MNETQPYIVFGSPSIGTAELDAVAKTLQSGWIGTGPRVHELETQFASYVGAKHGVATASCTAALHLSMLAIGVGPGDEVITTPLTFCATANAILHTGATPVFVDCEPGTMNIDPEAIAAAVTERTKAILPVHFAGRSVNLEAIETIAEKHGLSVIEDAAHAIETARFGRKVGSISKLTCFSFYVTKNMTTGEGGMVTTNDPALAARIKTLALHGLSADAWSRFSDTGYKHYEVVAPGFKYNLTDIAASLGLAQLPRLGEWLERRAEVWQRYDEAFADLPLDLPRPQEPDTVHARHLYTVLVRREAGLGRDEMLMALHNQGIGTGVHYRALHTHQYYAQRWGYRPEQFPVANDVGERTLSLPLSAKLTAEQVERIIAAVRKVLGRQ